MPKILADERWRFLATPEIESSVGAETKRWYWSLFAHGAFLGSRQAGMRYRGPPHTIGNARTGSCLAEIQRLFERIRRYNLAILPLHLYCACGSQRCSLDRGAGISVSLVLRNLHRNAQLRSIDSKNLGDGLFREDCQTIAPG